MGSTTNVYNGDGVLVQQDTTRYVQDLAAPLSQILSDGTNQYIYGMPAERLYGQQGTTRTWYSVDALGSVRATLDDAGTPIATAMYDAWGVPETPLLGSFGFTGELHQGSDVWLRARWYGAGRGGFGGRDPYAGDAQTPYSMMAYHYAYANPVSLRDPSGENVGCYVTGTRTAPRSGYHCAGGTVVNRSSSVIRIGGAFLNKACSRQQVIDEIRAESTKPEKERYYRTTCIIDNTTQTEAGLSFHYLYPGESSDDYAYVDADAVSVLRPQDSPTHPYRRLFKDYYITNPNIPKLYDSTWRYHPINFEVATVIDTPPTKQGDCRDTLEIQSFVRWIADARANFEHEATKQSWNTWAMNGMALNAMHGRHRRP